MILYHGTNYAEEILSEGFRLNKNHTCGVPRFGYGVYFTDNKDIAYDFGDVILEVEIKANEIYTIKFSEIAEMYNFTAFEKENNTGHAYELKEYILSKGYQGVKIVYEGLDYNEIVCYEPAIIKKITKYHESLPESLDEAEYKKRFPEFYELFSDEKNNTNRVTLRRRGR